MSHPKTNVTQQKEHKLAGRPNGRGE